MALIGRVSFLCDTKGCHAELVLDADDADLAPGYKDAVKAVFVASGWLLDQDGELRCGACCEQRDEDYERAAERARDNGFSRTSGKDWT